jgi:hypothetical protein
MGESLMVESTGHGERKHMRQNAAGKTIAILSLLAGLLLFSMNCKNITGSDEGFEARIIVTNNCGATLDIFMDDNFQFTIGTGSSATIGNLTEEQHTLEAFLTGTEVLVLTESFDATVEGDYEWTIAGQATIVVTNEYGEILYIYEAGEYLGVIEDDDSVTISEVPFGIYNFEAKTVDDGTVAAIASVEVTEIKEYSWVIK